MITPRHRIHAFTLTETLVILGLYVLIMAMVTGAVQSLYESSGYASAQAREVDNARRGMTMLVRDLREMTYAEDGTFPVARIEPHVIGFYSDIDKDDSVEYVEYELATTTLYKRTYAATGTPPSYDFSSPEETAILSRYVQNINQGTSTFFYFDTNTQPLGGGSLLTDVRYIRAQIIVNIDPVRSPGEYLLRNGVAPRNLKDNL